MFINIEIMLHKDIFTFTYVRTGNKNTGTNFKTSQNITVELKDIGSMSLITGCRHPVFLMNNLNFVDGVCSGDLLATDLPLWHVVSKDGCVVVVAADDEVGLVEVNFPIDDIGADVAVLFPQTLGVEMCGESLKHIVV